MTAPIPSAPVLLDAEQVDQLRRLLGTVEDWLLHAGDETRDDLCGFLAGLAWSTTSPERLAAALITDLGEHTVLLRRALTRALRTDNGCGEAS
jgi:hypothetical protein